jgi:hypothetical protein
MKLKLFSIMLACASASLARADFNPVALTPGSYTYSIVVPTNTVQALPYCINVTAGNGTNEGDNTYYEQGLYGRPGQFGGNSGIPPHNTVFTNINNPNITYVMPPNYATNNELMIDSDFTTGTLNFNTATTATNLSILACGGGGALSIGYIVNHSNGSTETGTLSLQDWFNGGATVAWGANGRITSGGGYNNFNSSAINDNPPYLYGYNIVVSGASPITSITFNYVSSGNHANFFAVSGNSSGSNWTPIPLNGFNVIGIVPAAFPLTATMDSGTNITSANVGNMNTWFEQGWVQSNPTAGLPPSGSTFSSQSQPTHHYQMGNYSANNAILIDTNHQVVNISPANPAAYSAFALLTAGGNVGNTPMQSLCILEHADGVKETNTLFGYDWFYNNAPGSIAFEANGRVNMDSRSVNNITNNYPYLFETYFPLTDTTSPVTNILVIYESASSTNATTYIMAVSASSGGIAPVVTVGPLPVTQTWFPTQTASFSVQTSGTAPVTNTWLVENNGVYVPLKDGLDANGSTVIGSQTTSLTISNLTLADGTNYEFIASNAFGSNTSAPAILIVNSTTPSAPVIDSQIPAASFSVLTNRLTTTVFSVTVDTNTAPPIFYQWFLNSVAIPNATNSTYPNVDTNAVTLYCVVSNFVGTATSTPVSISFYSKPAPSAYMSAVLAYNPLAYWPLNETSGTTAYDYAGTNDGTYTGNYTLGQTGIPVTAGIGTNTSVGFDGSTAYVDVPVGNLNVTGAVTLIQWVQTTSTSFQTTLGHSDQSYRFDVATQPHFADPGPDATGSIAVNDGNWHQLVGVFDGTNDILYVDGKVAATVVDNSGIPNSTDHVWIGGAPDYPGGRNLNGNSAQVAIIAKALTAPQVLAIFNSLGTAPVVTVTPSTPSIYVGTSLTFTAQLTGGQATKLQWYYIDTSSVSNNIPGATNVTYTLSNASLAENGYTYGINAINAFGSVTATASLTVSDTAAFLNTALVPANAEAYAGAPVTYSVDAQGSLPISYQWTLDNIPVAGATNQSFTFAAPCGTHSVGVSFTNNLSGGTPVPASSVSLQGDSYPTNITFNTNGANWQLNSGSGNTAGLPSIGTNTLELTDGAGGEASSAFYTVPQYVGDFVASFTYVGNGSADGTAFVLQNYSFGDLSLGGGGGALGYNGISNSIALEFNLYQSIGIAAGTNGSTGVYGPTSPVDIGLGDPINVVVNFANGVMGVSLTDTLTKATFSTNYMFGSLLSSLGGNLAYIGFSGGDGGATSIQTVSNFQFHSIVTPASLSVSHVTNNAVVISWPATNPSYSLEMSPSLTTPSWTAGPTATVTGNTASVSVRVNGTTAEFFRLVRSSCN